MNKNEIGKNAGIVWRLLENHTIMKYDELKQRSQLSDRELSAAIGWLARENKLDIDVNDKGEYDQFHLPLYNLFY
jgi:hypothetical protein